jgi:opacity protein-like surface antigen
MRRLTITAFIVMSGWALTSRAQAADPPFPPLSAPEQAFAVSEFISSWYVRGDLGYRFFATPGGSISNANFLGSSYDDAFAFGGGIGFKAKWFRSDVTLEGSRAHFLANTAAATPDVSARITNVTTLLNAYFDLGTWSRVTPYVGAGAGFSFLKATAVDIASPVTINSNPHSYDFAWAATAGLSYAVTRNFLIDTGYRYLHVGSPQSNLANAGLIDYGSANAHEIRMGIRFLID